MNTASAEYMSSLPPRAPPVHPLKLEVEPPVTTLHVAPPAVKKARSALASRGQQAPPSLPGVPSAPPAHAPSSAAAAARAKADLARRLAEAARQRCEAAQTSADDAEALAEAVSRAAEKEKTRARAARDKRAREERERRQLEAECAAERAAPAAEGAVSDEELARRLHAQMNASRRGTHPAAILAAMPAQRTPSAVRAAAPHAQAASSPDWVFARSPPEPPPSAGPSRPAGDQGGPPARDGDVTDLSDDPPSPVTRHPGVGEASCIQPHGADGLATGDGGEARLDAAAPDAPPLVGTGKSEATATDGELCTAAAQPDCHAAEPQPAHAAHAPALAA